LTARSLLWIDARWAWSSELRAAYGNIGELLARCRAAKHDSPAAHITEADEFGRKQQAVVEHFEEGGCVFGAGNTSEKHERALLTRGAVK